MALAWTGAPWAPHRWQAEALPAALAWLRDGRSPIVRACTGAGKSILTAELAYLAALRGRTVVLAVPTESLVEQSAATLARRIPKVARWYGRRHERGPVTVCCYPSLDGLLLDLASRGLSVDLLIADECHGTEAERRQASIEAAAATWRVGVTATPYRADEREALSLWDGVCYEYGIGDAMADGVLVPIVVREPDCPEGTRVDDALDAMYRDLPRRDDGQIRPGVVSAISVDDAESYTERLRADGWRAAAVHYRVPPDIIAERIEGLRAGALDLLVHVSMLSEGVDLPWLWWTALRRPLASRVALVQTVGRVVRVDRTDPAKTCAIVLDPHGLCSSVGLVHPARIGDGHAIDEEGPQSEREPPEDPVPMTLEGRTVRMRASEAERLWRELAAGLEARGLLEPGIARGRWARKPATAKQRAALGRMKWATKHLPDLYREPWRRLASHSELTCGCATDLLSLSFAAASGGKEARERHQRWVLELETEDADDA